jgi:hypothetical protein
MSETELQTTPPEFAAELAQLLDSVDARDEAEVGVDGRCEWWTYTIAAGLLVIGFFIAQSVYWVPAHPGVDQNGYLVGGRMLAENLSMHQTPRRAGSNQFDPNQFVGRMWVGADLGTPQERYYPKYPIGLPLLVAIALWIGGEAHGPIFAYWINPIAMSLAVLATFMLIRQITRSFWAFCGAILFATSPLVFGLTNNPNSHATSVCFATWGMYLLIRWWKAGGRWRAVCAGLLLGYVGTIRYSEGLLILPILAVIAIKFNWRDRRGWIESFYALLGWLIPIGILASYNYLAMGRLTGYDGTNESLGFSLAYAADNWETMLRQLASFAMTFVFPFAVIGLITMLWRNWRMGLVMLAWIVPCVLCYVFYYWAPDPQQQPGTFVSYMRFVVTIVPGLFVCACWLVDQVCLHMQGMHPGRWAFRSVEIALGLLMLAAVAVQLKNSTIGAELDQHGRLMLKKNADSILNVVPEGAVLFAQDTSVLHHLQFLRDYALYTGETFNKSFIDNLPRMDPDEPQGWEPGRRDALYNRLKGMTQPQLDEEQRKIMTAAIDSGRRVFFVIARRVNDPPVGQKFSGEKPGTFPGATPWVRRFATVDRFDLHILSAWTTPIVRPIPPNTTRTRAQRAEIRTSGPSPAWQIVEVTKRTTPLAAPAPTAPRPAARPAATRPAATRPAATRPAATRPAQTRPATARSTIAPS